jgi:hypothetical protein
MLRTLSALTIIVASVLAPGGSIAVAAAPFCEDGQVPAFSDGFAALADSIGPRVGVPIECAHSDSDSGDIAQRTTTGLAYYIADQNLPVFVSDWSSERSQSWALLPDGLQYVYQDRATGETARLQGFADVYCGAPAAATADLDTVLAYCDRVERDSAARSTSVRVSSPPAVPLIATPTAVATATSVISYPTRKGPRTSDDLAGELRRAGYTGPWDVTSMLAAFDRATAPTPTPVSTATPVPAPIKPLLDPLLASRCFQFAFNVVAANATYMSRGADFSGFVQALENGCRQAAIDKGTVGEDCYEFAVNRTFQANLTAGGGVSPSLIESLYGLCVGS